MSELSSIGSNNPHSTVELRSHPLQLRSARRVATIEAAAIAMIAKHGRDGFTTAQIAEHAGMSVGIVYRYFTDRVAILRWLYPELEEGLGALRDGAGDVRFAESALLSTDEPTGASATPS